jgi:uncharacterized phage protein (TIGR02220 family)
VPRIRTVKPDFFRHEGLQDLEASNPKRYPMLVFAGLWGHCDKAGRFEWKPRTLKLDILPFLDFEMAQTLTLLEAHRFVRRYTVDGKAYGVIDSFSEHQRINGRESQEPERYPEPPPIHDEEESRKLLGSDAEASGTTGREGKGTEDVRHPPDELPGKNRELRKSALEVLMFLNERAGRSFEPLANLDLILGRLREGASVEDCKAVVQSKCEQWASDEKMSQYLRPKTLFNKTNFATYKGEIGSKSNRVKFDV